MTINIKHLIKNITVVAVNGEVNTESIKQQVEQALLMAINQTNATYDQSSLTNRSQDYQKWLDHVQKRNLPKRSGKTGISDKRHEKGKPQKPE